MINKTKLISFLSVVVSVRCISNIIYAALQDDAVVQGAVRKVIRMNPPDTTVGYLGHMLLHKNKADLAYKKGADNVLKILDKTEFFVIENGERKPTSLSIGIPGWPLVLAVSLGTCGGYRLTIRWSGRRLGLD